MENEKSSIGKRELSVFMTTQEEDCSISQHEDAVLKTMMQFFADELLPYLGVRGKVISIAPTESVHLEVKKMFQDFNLVMEDKTWKHFEFQSTNEGVKGLKRFRVYESVASYQHNVSVTTYVLYSGKIKRPVIEFSEGINTYRVIPIIMRNKNADKLIKRLLRKKTFGEPITREELVQLVLCPLMGGKMSQKERIKAAYEITREAIGVNPEEIRKIEAVIYAMADKFLESMDLEEIKEEMCMTRLGQMLVNEGREQGREQGESRVNSLNLKLLQDKRYDDLERAANDKEYQRKLFAEFNL